MMKKPGQKAKPPAPLRAPSAEEKRGIEAAWEARRKFPIPTRTNIKNPRPNVSKMFSPHSDAGGWQAQLEAALGTHSWEFLSTELGRICEVLKGRDGTFDPKHIDAVFAILTSAKPANEIEAMLVVQMAVTHAMTMRYAGYLNRNSEIPMVDSSGLAFARLTKTFTSQIEALAKLRRGGEQKVTVEHVHVYPGGQAVVGNVTHTGGAGGILENNGQPHAANDPRTLALAAGAPMLCQDPQREALPVPNCERKEAVPDARRRTGIGGPEGKPKR